jgi:hypothetical protein
MALTLTRRLLLQASQRRRYKFGSLRSLAFGELSLEDELRFEKIVEYRARR